MKVIFCWVCFTLFAILSSSGSPLRNNVSYKPVVIIHGLHDSPNTLQFFADFIAKAHPGTNVTLIHILHGLPSLLPMWHQVDRFKPIVSTICKADPNGIHLIGYSQGALVARAIVQSLDNHPIENFISITGPQNGQFGETDLMKKIPLYNWGKNNAYRFLYTKMGQLISFGNYWKDPHHLDLYRKHNKFLPILNNETYNEHSEEYKKNFIRLKKVVLIGSMNDTTITPWQSSHFAFYDEDEKIVEMRNQEVYQRDSFGLRTLDERGDLVLDTISGLDHKDIPNSGEFIQDHVLPYLT